MKERVETEIKLRMASPAAAREAVRTLGARRVRRRHLEDNLLLDDGQGTLAGSGKALRVRRTDDAPAVLTFKGPREGPAGLKSRAETEMSVGDADTLLAILEGLGYRKTFRYQKYRETYAWKDGEIVVDETPIGTFLEVEASAESIHEAARALGFTEDQYVCESYAALYFASGGQGDMVFA